MYRRQPTPAINVTPLVDVLLVLAVVLILAAPLSAKRIPVNPPVTAAAVGGAAKHWQLGFDLEKRWYLNGQKVTFQAVKAAVPRGASIELAADSRLSYGAVAEAMDELRGLDPADISLTVK
jgi:biopolymer transport protein ExbD/biopolymer transport protein TolR